MTNNPRSSSSRHHFIYRQLNFNGIVPFQKFHPDLARQLPYPCRTASAESVTICIVVGRTTLWPAGHYFALFGNLIHLQCLCELRKSEIYFAICHFGPGPALAFLFCFVCAGAGICPQSPLRLKDQWWWVASKAASHFYVILPQSHLNASFKLSGVSCPPIRESGSDNVSSLLLLIKD